MTHHTHKFAIVALLLCWHPLTRAACLNGPITIPGEFDSSDYVVLATPISTVQVPASSDGYFLAGQESTIKITQIFKGNPTTSLTLFSEYSSGGFPLDLNKPYVLFIYLADNRLLVDNCGYSGRVEKSRSVIDAVRTLAAHRGATIDHASSAK